MTKAVRTGLLFGLGLFLNTAVWAQVNLIDRLDLSGDIAGWYDSLVGKENPVLFQGELADMQRRSLKSHPYLGRNEWQLGNVIYRHQEFRAVPLLYNLEKDQLLLLRNGQNSYEMFIALKSDLVSGFTVNDARYVRIVNGPLPRPGFYEELFSGEKLSFYVKRVKSLKKNGTQGMQYVQADQYYVLFENEFYLVRNLGSLTRIFKSNRKLIKNFAFDVGARNLNAETEKQFVLLAIYCNSLDL